MNEPISIIPLENLMIMFVPPFILIGIFYYWSHDWRNIIYALTRMLGQLLLIGYVLSYIFSNDNYNYILLILLIMVSIASWISLRTVPKKRTYFLKFAFLSIFFGGGLILLLVTQIVLEVDPWFSPQNLIPLGGMIFASSMNGVSLAAERLIAETDRGLNFDDAKGIALKASLIPIINSLFAVGLVSLPGMMTGQILSGVPPHIAVKYQILVMLMLFSAVGFTSVFFLGLIKKVSNI